LEVLSAGYGEKPITCTKKVLFGLRFPVFPGRSAFPLETVSTGMEKFFKIQLFLILID